MPEPPVGKVVRVSMTGEVELELDTPDIPAYENDLFSPTSAIAFDDRCGGNGDIWVADGYGQSLVHRYNAAGDFLSSIDGTEGAGRFDCPHSLWIDTRPDAPELLVADRANGRVQVFDPNGTFLATLIESGSAEGMLTTPTGIKLDDEGNLWVVDRGNNRVQKFTAQGELLAVYGSAGDDEGQFLVPTSINFDAAGNFFVSEVSNSRVQAFSPEGEFLGEVAAGLLRGPHGLAFDSTGALYITDTGNGLVRKFEPLAP